jgi:glycosyltransferase involved in cell wall biosynthesis
MCSRLLLISDERLRRIHPEHPVGKPLARKRMMKIALVITGLGMGGAENQVVNLADRFAALEHPVLLIALTGDAVVLPRNPAVKVMCLGMSKTPWGLWSAWRRAAGLLRDFRPDVVHSHMVHANIFCRLLRMAVSMPRLICSAHSSDEGGAARMVAYRLTDGLADMSSNVSQDAVDASIQRGAVRRQKIIAVPNGIDCDRFQFNAVARSTLRARLNLPDGHQAILAVGRFTEAKDYSNLLTSFASLCEVRGNCRLWIAGAGDQQPVFEAQARRLMIDSKVLFLGMRRDIHDLMSAADVFVLSSAWEGLPLVVGEAMACERLVVSTDAGGIREWLGGLGFVVPTRHSAALAAALRQALEMEVQEKEAQGRVARQRVVQRYSLGAVVDNWLEIYAGNFNDVALSAECLN